MQKRHQFSANIKHLKTTYKIKDIETTVQKHHQGAVAME